MVYKGIAEGHTDNETLVHFLNYVFGMNGIDQSFYRLHPKLYKETVHPERYNWIVKEGEKLRAAVGGYPIRLMMAGEELQGLGIGNVAVHPAARGRGYMQDCMKMAIAQGLESGADFSVLSGRRQRYAHYGYQAVGVCASFTLMEPNIRYGIQKEARQAGIVVKRLQKEDLSAITYIQQLVQSRSSYCIRDPEAYFDVLSTWESQVYGLYDAGNRQIGYFLYGGMEQGTISELDCEDPSLLDAVVYAIYQFLGREEISIIVQEGKTGLYHLLSEIAEEIRLQTNERYCVYHYEKVLRSCMKRKKEYAELPDGSLTVCIHGYAGEERLQLAVSQGQPLVSRWQGECEIELFHEQAMQLFFGLPGCFHPDALFHKKKKVAMLNWFPLPLYVPYVDNV